MKAAVWLAPLVVAEVTLLAAPMLWKSLRAETDLAARVAAVRAPLHAALETCAPLHAALEPCAPLGTAKPLVVLPLAVDASSIQEWAAQRGPLAAKLDRTLKRLRAAQLLPDWVLWQQGEADALIGTTEADCAESLRRLRAHLQVAGVTAPLLAARPTHCKGADGTAVRAAIVRLTH